MTLTTEQLRARAAALRTDAATLAELGDTESSQRLNESANAFDELAANREAQPVALVDRRPAASGSICWQNGGKDLPHGTKLFTAPPAPAVSDDTRRMDWLVAHHVTVRKPLRYGSEAMFTAQTITDEEDDYHATKLREQIDAEMVAAAPEGGNG